jgi:hypothetical protein
MKKQQLSSQTKRATIPPQVWETLTPAQQQTIFQTIVRICRHLATQWREEEHHEPQPKRQSTNG